MKKYLFMAATLAAMNCRAQSPTKTIPVPTYDTVAAWENGSLLFHNADIKTIMGAVSVFYKVDIVYAGKLPERKLAGMSIASPIDKNGVFMNDHNCDVLPILKSKHELSEHR